MSMIDTWAFLQLLKEDGETSPEKRKAEAIPETQDKPVPTMREMLGPGKTGRMFFCLFKVLGTIALILAALYLIHEYGILYFLCGAAVLLLLLPLLILLVCRTVVLVCDLILSLSR